MAGITILLIEDTDNRKHDDMTISSTAGQESVLVKLGTRQDPGPLQEAMQKNVSLTPRGQFSIMILYRLKKPGEKSDLLKAILMNSYY